jgi:radical SAM protein with 4Fe4S-binding SPASM domain
LNKRIYDIENGYFVFTVFSSLRCSLDCPHCYLSKFDRKFSPSLDLNTDFKNICIKINDYFVNEIPKQNKKDIIAYWYGGEPTELGPSYFYLAKAITDNIFDKSINFRHQILSNLMGNMKIWIPLFKHVCNNYVQTSYDYLMRGKNYLNIWKKNVILVHEAGIKISAINVVNKTMIGKEQEIFDELTSLNIYEIGFLPFMKNTTNMAENGSNYLENAATMAEYSEFVINFTKIVLKDFDINKPNYGLKIIIGPMHHILYNKILIENGNNDIRNNIAGQTMFLLPKGDFVLPDYKDNYFNEEEYINKFGNIDRNSISNGNCLDNGIEYLRKFENILNNDMKTVLNSSERQDYLSKQKNRDNQEECKNCQYQNICLMEFWKTTNLDNSDECPGAKKYIEYLNEFYNNLNLQEKEIIINDYMNTQLT